MAADFSREQVDAFIVAEIDSVPHLEALLILWNCRPEARSVDEIAKLLYVPRELAAKVLADLTGRGLLVAGEGVSHRYQSRSQETDNLMRNVEAMHRLELIRISGLIHSKASAAVRDFARAFRFKKDRD